MQTSTVCFNLAIPAERNRSNGSRFVMNLSESSRVSQTLLTLAAFMIVVAGLKAAAPIVVPMLMAIFLSIISIAPLQWLQRHGLPLWLSMALIFTILITTLVIVGSTLGASITQLTATLPGYETQLVDLIDRSAMWVSSQGIDIPAGGIVGLIDPEAAAKFFGRVVSGFGGLIADSMLILFTVLFILVESTTIPSKLRSFLKNPNDTLLNFSGFMDGVTQYLVIKGLMSLITGALITIYLLMLDINFALLWGALAFFMNFVPYIGSIIAAVPVVILALLDAGPGTALAVGAGFLAANMIVGNVLEPRFTGQGLGLSTLVVFVSLVFWGWVFGPVGMFLSTPLTMLMKIALENDPRSRWISILLSSEAPASPPKY